MQIDEDRQPELRELMYSPTTRHPAPHELIRAVAALLGDERPTHSVVAQEMGESSTTWTFLGLAPTRLIFVRATAAKVGWKAGDRETAENFEAWTRAFSDVDAIHLEDTDPEADEGSWAWSWDTRIRLELKGGPSIAIPIGERSTNSSERARLDEFISELIRRFGAP